ncbi:MAG TPA: hypothetical protein VLA22_05795 [Gaiellaceae bacterium]|nr:hypothetical protein [Gaiellaceae bacterium]
MKTKTRRLVWVIGLLAGLVLVGTVVASASAQRPAGMSPEDYQALMLRSEALNELHGGGAPLGMSAAAYRALVIRSQGMNELANSLLAAPASETLPGTSAQSPPYPQFPPAQVAPAEGSGFDWGTAGIVAAGALVVVLLVAGGISLGVHRSRTHRAHAAH